MDAQALQAAMPGLEAGRAKELVGPLARAMLEGNITTRQRAAAFLAQVGHESLSLVFLEEIADGSAYEGRRDLGNIHPGDGPRYKGRGAIMLTGRTNYRAAGVALRLPLEANPTIAAQPAVAFRIAVWYWTTRGLNELADRRHFDAITQRINGGQNGRDDRRRRWTICRELGYRILPDPFHPLSATERKIVGRVHRHRRRREKVWAAWWTNKLRRQMHLLRRQARRAGKRGWAQHQRGLRYQLLADVRDGKR